MSKLINFPRLRDSRTGKPISIKVSNNFSTNKLKQIKSKATEQANKLKKLFNS